MTATSTKEPHATQLDRLLQSPPRQFLATLWGLMLIGILGVGLFWLFVQHSSVNFQEQQRDQLGRHLSLILAAQAAQNWTPAALEQQANLVSQQPLILEVMFHDTQGVELAHSRSRQSVEDYFGAKANPTPNRSQIFIEPVQRNQQLLGYVRVALNRALVDKPYRELRKLTLYALLAMVTLAGCLAYYIGHHSISSHLPRWKPATLPVRNYRRKLKDRAMNPDYLLRRFEQQPGCFTRGAQNALLLLRWHQDPALNRRQLGALALLHGGSLLAINPQWILLCLSDEKDSQLAERALQCARLISLWCRLKQDNPAWSLSIAQDNSDAASLIQQAFSQHQSLLAGQTALNQPLQDCLQGWGISYKPQTKQLPALDEWRERLLQRQLNQLISLTELQSGP